MSDLDARAAQQAMRSIAAAKTTDALHTIEVTAAVGGYAHLIRDALVKRSAQLERGRR